MRIYLIVCCVLYLNIFSLYAEEPLSNKVKLQKIETIQKNFDSSIADDKFWFYSWAAIMGTGLIGSTTLYFVLPNDNDFRQTLPINIGVTGLGLANLLIFYPYSMSAKTKLEKMPSASQEQIDTKLKVAEGMLKKTALRTRLATNWLAHAGSILVNIGAGLIEAIHYQEPLKGSLRALGGIIIGTIKIETQPDHAIQAWQDYQENRKQASYIKEVRVAFWGYGGAVTMMF